MQSNVTRRPIGNFFIKKALQIRLIVNIAVAVLISTLVSTGSLILVYFLKYNTVIVYQLEKITQELSREHIVYLILPSIIVSVIVNIIIAIGVGLYASRKYAVPIYKLEHWAAMVCEGKLNVGLRFREKEEMKELSDQCNQLTSNLKEKLLIIKIQTDILKENGSSQAAIAEIERVLSQFETKADEVEVEKLVGSKK